MSNVKSLKAIIYLRIKSFVQTNNTIWLVTFNVYLPNFISPMSRMLFVVLLIFSFSCHKDRTRKHSSGGKAFYYWQTDLQSFSWRDSIFQSMNIDKIYYRFFDVDWNVEAKAAVPVSPLRVDAYDWQPKHEIVPVVFITNETFKNLTLAQSGELATQVHRKIMTQLNLMLMSGAQYTMYGEFDWSSKYDPYRVKSKKFDEQWKYDSLYRTRLKSIKEIQFDCDWTKSTRDKYFAFLESAMKIFKDKTVTSTVRLYQYKYPVDAGVPPVSRAMLMCYNAGDVQDLKTTNSIFDKKEIMRYLENEKRYPIPLDYALPIFEWALLFHDGKLKRIISPSDLTQDHWSHLRKAGDNVFVATEDFVFGYTVNSSLIRKGDQIRLEIPRIADVREIAEWLSEHRNNDNAILTLYHLNDHDVKKYSKEIEDIFNSF